MGSIVFQQTEIPFKMLYQSIYYLNIGFGSCEAILMIIEGVWVFRLLFRVRLSIFHLF